MATLKVLIVDDEPGIRSGIERILSNFSVGFPFMEEDFTFQCTEALTGEEAIEIIESNAPDIVLLDNKLPGIYGIEVLEYIRKKQFDILVMMITSYASLDLAIKATQNGAYNFVPKPFTPHELKSAMEGITKHLYLKRMASEMTNNSKQAKFQFLSVLSHELKSPINAVEGYLKMIQDRQLGTVLETYDKMIDRSLERLNNMRTLIHDLLDLTKIESGKSKTELKINDVVEIARKALFSVEPLAIQKKITINFDIPETLYMKIDILDIESIFNNLLSNAVKYSKNTGGIVTFTLKQTNESMVISVEDNGIGLSQEEISKLFNEFVRIRSDKTKNISGSGLGLSIVKKIVDEYNGKIEVKSEPDKGSLFSVVIPLQK